MNNIPLISPVPPPRARGGACLECRRKKKRCDGGQPCLHCRNAIAGPLDCEYAALGELAESQVLEQDIARLEEQIYILEHPEQKKSDTVFLHAPYISNQPNQSRLDPATFHKDEQCELLETFLEQFQSFGLFLNPNTIRHSLHSQIPSLGAAVLLWATRLTPALNSPDITNGFLYQALRQLQVDIGNSHPQRCIQAIQVDILLALWYLNAGAFLQARYRANHAVSLCISERLHLNAIPMDHRSATLTAPLNQAEAKQRVDAFWTTLVVANLFTLDGSLIPFNYPSEDPAVTTVWPTSGNLVAAPPRNTITDFLHGLHGWSDTNSLVFIARASIVYERTMTNINLSSMSDRPDMATIPSTNANALENRLVAMKLRVEEQSSVTQEMILTRMILDVGMLSLHRSTNPNNHDLLLVEIGQVAQAVDSLRNLPIVPIVLPLVTFTADTILQVLQSSQPAFIHRKQLRTAIDSLMGWLQQQSLLSPAATRDLEHLQHMAARPN
ncbi:hypothetical protein DL96DRAFT_672506 [Flagelloscypha sp. PMI_526]|nr:hypothetical protein DL96DRAFT_672506 [Flagelloscypha sp. PMI_526]